MKIASLHWHETNDDKSTQKGKRDPDIHATLALPPFNMPQYLESPLTIPKNRDRRTLSSVAISAGNNSRISSGASLWAEDYFNADTEVASIQSDNFQTQLEGINYHPHSAVTPPTLPPAAATTSRPFPRSVPISEDEDSYPPQQTRTHQRSLTALLPFLPPKTRSRGNSKSPERPFPISSYLQSPKKEKSKQEADEEFMATLTGDRGGIIKVEEKRGGGLAGWFSGSSAPVAVGIPVDDSDSLPPTMSNSREVSPERRRRPTLQTSESNISAVTTQSRTPAQQLSTSRFANLFSSNRSNPNQQTIQLPTSTLQADELLTLDIQQALFPAGPQSPNDPFSPAAYKNLLMNAEGTLLKLQTAYKLRVSALHELSSEKEAQADELEEAEMRNRALKSQLDNMARETAREKGEQDCAMSKLLLELATEKQARAEEKAAREQSIREVRENRERMEREGKRASCCAGTHGEEDLGIDLAGTSTKKEWRRSHGSATGEGESESDADSVFSRSMSPTTTSYAGSETASTLTMESSAEILQASFGRMVTVQGVGRPKMQKQQSTFQKILKVNTSQPQENKMGEEGCERCMGKDSSVAWDTVGLLKAENRGLKDRVGELEGAVEGALDLVAGLRF